MKIPQAGVYSQLGTARQSAHVNKLQYGRDFEVYQDFQGYYIYSDDHKGNKAGKKVYSTGDFS